MKNSSHSCEINLQSDGSDLTFYLFLRSDIRISRTEKNLNCWWNFKWTPMELFRIIDSHAFTSLKATDNLRLIGNYFVCETRKWSGARNVYTATKKKANRKARTNINFTFLSSKISCKRGFFFFFRYHRLLRRWNSKRFSSFRKICVNELVKFECW